jgi:hypothetical protein
MGRLFPLNPSIGLRGGVRSARRRSARSCDSRSRRRRDACGEGRCGGYGHGGSEQRVPKGTNRAVQLPFGREEHARLHGPAGRNGHCLRMPELRDRIGRRRDERFGRQGCRGRPRRVGWFERCERFGWCERFGRTKRCGRFGWLGRRHGRAQRLERFRWPGRQWQWKQFQRMWRVRQFVLSRRGLVVLHAARDVRLHLGARRVLFLTF